MDHTRHALVFVSDMAHALCSLEGGADGADLVRGARRVSDPFDKYIFLYLSFELL